jgi:hypothetical protein
MRQAFPLGSQFRLPVELVENKTGGKFLREVGKEQWSRLINPKVYCQFSVPKGGDKLKAFLKSI